MRLQVVVVAAFLLAGCSSAAPTPSSAPPTQAPPPHPAAEPVSFSLTSPLQACAGPLCVFGGGTGGETYVLNGTFAAFDLNVTASQTLTPNAGAAVKDHITVSCVPAKKTGCAGGTVAQGDTTKLPLHLAAKVAMAKGDLLRFTVTGTTVAGPAHGSGAMYDFDGTAWRIP